MKHDITLQVQVTEEVGRELLDQLSTKLKQLSNPAPERPRILTVSEAAALLKQSKRHRIDDVVSLAIFTGLRIEELRDLSWEDIDLNAGIITAPRIRLGQRPRTVRILPVVVRWLKTIVGQHGPVVTKDFDPNWKRAIREAKLRKCSLFTLQKTFAAYHLATFDDPQATAEILEWGDAETTQAKIGMVEIDSGDAAAYWALLDEDGGDHGGGRDGRHSGGDAGHS